MLLTFPHLVSSSSSLASPASFFRLTLLSIYTYDFSWFLMNLLLLGIRTSRNMSAKLKVDELRAQLSLRGLDTSGSKPTLVSSLFYAPYPSLSHTHPNHHSSLSPYLGPAPRCRSSEGEEGGRRTGQGSWRRWIY